jgi:hypothetical protein
MLPGQRGETLSERVSPNKIAVPVNRNRELWPNHWLGY